MHKMHKKLLLNIIYIFVKICYFIVITLGILNIKKDLTHDY